MVVRGEESDHVDLSGHALMLTCPPASHYRDNPNDEHYHQLPNASTSSLMRLLEMSFNLPISGDEMAPVQALEIIRNHERVSELTRSDMEKLQNELFKYMNCYGCVLSFLLTLINLPALASFLIILALFR